MDKTVTLKNATLKELTCIFSVPATNPKGHVYVEEKRADARHSFGSSQGIADWLIEQQPFTLTMSWGNLYVFWLEIESIRIRNSFYPLPDQPIQFNYQWRLL